MSDGGEAPFQLGNGRLHPFPTCRMAGTFELTLQFNARQTKGFPLPLLFWLLDHSTVAAFAFLLPRVDLFLQSCLGIDEAFSRITHWCANPFCRGDNLALTASGIISNL